MTIPSPKVDFYNLQTANIRGVGQVKQVRSVTPRRGKPFTACTLVALLGPSKQPRHRYFDCEVTGQVAAQEILKCKEACDAGRKIMIKFELSTAELNPFTYRNGDRKDEVGFTEKASLATIDWLTIDDELKYQADANTNSKDAADELAPAASAASANAPEPIAAAS